jgi:hypothetical protein
MKKVIIASILVVGLATGVAYAHNNNWGGQGYGGHMMGGNGMMGNGYGQMGPGMMGNGYGGGNGQMGPGMMGAYGGGYGDCPGSASFGKDGWNSESHQKFLEDTVGLRKELNDKGFEYAEAQRSPNTTREQLAAIEKEVIDIRTKLQEKAEQSFKN